MLAFAGAVAVFEGGENGGGPEPRRDGVGVGAGDADGLGVGPAGEMVDAHERPQGRADAGVLGVGAVGALHRRAEHDGRWLLHGEVVVAEAPAGHDAGAEVLVHHVGPAAETLGDGEGLRLAQVEGDAELAWVDVGVVGGAVAAGLAPEGRPDARAVEAVVGLDLDHRGAVDGEHLGDERPGDGPSEVGHLHPVERAAHFVNPPHLPTGYFSLTAVP